VVRDFIYYRCSGTDGYRFGGERICDNPQVQGEFIEAVVWAEACGLLNNPMRLEQEHQQKLAVVPNPENPEILNAQLRKLQRGMERLIDSYSEGVIEKEQFTSRLNRNKQRIKELEIRIRASAQSADGGQELRLLVDYYRKLAAHLRPDLEHADWNRRREIIRRLVERIDVGHERIAVVFRVPEGVALSPKDPIIKTFSRCSKCNPYSWSALSVVENFGQESGREVLRDPHHHSENGHGLQRHWTRFACGTFPTREVLGPPRASVG
jgi:site-specific DNA recombinase